MAATACQSEALQQELISWLQNTREFVSSQAPEVAQQMLQWGLINNHIGLVLTGLFTMAAVAIVLTIYFVARREKNWDNDDKAFAIGATTVFTLLVLIVGGSTMKGFATDLLKIKYTPKVYLLEKLTQRGF